MKVSTLLPSRMGLGVLLSGLALLAACSYTHESLPQPACPAVPVSVSYKTDVLPILKDDCYRCHSADNYNKTFPDGSNGTLNMESFAALSAWSHPIGGAESYLVGSIRQLPGYNKMPFDGKEGPNACEIALIKAWVDAGAPNN